MAAKVEILSKQMIKPSFLTHPTLRTHTLSFLDQMSPRDFIPLIFFYQHDINKRAKDVQSLKQSLSEALTRFYPLAGRLNGDRFVDCNDTGVEFIEAQVHGHFSAVLENPKIEELDVLLPVKDCDIENKDDLLSIQVNLFDGGEIAIGVQMCHKVGDFSSMVTFINAWATIARGDIKNIVQPNFVWASNILPVIDMSNFISAVPEIKYNKKFLRRFVFNKEKIDAIKKSVTSGSQVKDPTRVEALSSLIWKHFNEYSKLKKVNALQVVNLRSRMNSILPDHPFGNLVAGTIASLPNGQESENYDLVHHMRNAIRSIGSDYLINASKNGEESLKNVLKQLEGISELCQFTSWCRFPYYEVDFGWGKPIRCTTTFSAKNIITFMDTKCGEGIEAYVRMVEDDGFAEALSQLTSS